MAPSSGARIQLDGLNGQKLSCLSVSGKHFGLNSRYLLNVSGVAEKPLDARDFQQCALQITDQNKQYHYHGMLLSLQQEIVLRGKSHFCLSLGCSLHALDNEANQRVYLDKSIEEIIRDLLSSHGIKAQFHFENLDTRQALVVQGGVSDYDFLLRLCIKYGLVFSYQQHAHGATLRFTNHVLDAVERNLEFNPGNGLYTAQSHITSLVQWYASLPDAICLRGTKEDAPNVVFSEQTENQTTIPGQGLVRLSHQYNLNRQEDCMRHAICLQEQLDWQREWMRIDIDGVLVQPGDLVSISGYPGISTSNNYRIVDTAFSLDLSGDTTSHKLHACAYLISASTAYRMPEVSTRMAWPKSFFHAGPPHCLEQPINYPTPALNISEIAGDDNNVQLDSLGRYQTRFYFDENHEKNDRRLPFVRLLQPAAGSHPERPIGFHWPLQPGTRVVTANLYNQLSQPVILGALPDCIQPSPVTDVNASSLALRHPSKSALVLFDTENQQRIELHTQNASHGLFFQKDNQNEQIIAQSGGYMKLQSKHKLLVSAGGHIETQSKKTYFQSNEEMSISTAKTMRLNAKEIRFEVGNDWLATCKKETTVQAEKFIKALASTITLQSSSLKVHAGSGHLFANSALIFYGEESQSYGVKASRLLLSDGAISLQAPTITFIASAIIKNQGIAARVQAV